MFLLRDKLITQGEKRETSTQNVQRNNVARQSLELLCLVFRHLKSIKSRSLWHACSVIYYRPPQTTSASNIFLPLAGHPQYTLFSTDLRQPQDLIVNNILLATFADAYQVTDGTGATRAACMNEQGRDILFHRVSGSGQMISGQWRLSLT